MRLIYSLGGDRSAVLYLEAQVRFVVPGAIIVRNNPSQLGPRIPLLTLQYELGTLGGVSAILGQMKCKHEEPVVYVWDEEKPEPEVAILFRTDSPEKEVLDRISGSTGALVNATVVEGGRVHAFTLAEVNLSSRYVRQLVADSAALDMKLVVDVHETGTQLDVRAEPIARFTGARLKREELPRLL